MTDSAPHASAGSDERGGKRLRGAHRVATRGLAGSRVVVLGAPHGAANSMVRFARLLADAYRDVGADCEVVIPPSPLSSRARRKSVQKWLRYIESYVLFPFVARRHLRGADLAHIADHSNAHWLLWRRRDVLSVITCHDLIAVRAARGEIPQHQPRATGRVYQRVVEAGLRRADGVLADSRATARDVERIVPEVGVRTVHIGLDPALETSVLTTTERRASAVIVAPSDWRKGRADAIRVWQALREDPRLHDLALTIVGPPLVDAERAQLAPAEHAAIVVRTAISESELRDIYAAATVLITMSRYEGFGWPVVEAQCSATPAVCSDIEVHREVGGDGAIYLDADSPSWAIEPLVDQLLDPELPLRARANARRFTHANFTAELADAIRLLASAANGPVAKAL